MTTKYISMKDLENFFMNKALKSRWDETVKYINLKDEILSLPSLESKIDTLQRYKSTPDDFCTMQASWEWEYVKYSDLKKLLED